MILKHLGFFSQLYGNFACLTLTPQSMETMSMTSKNGAIPTSKPYIAVNLSRFSKLCFLGKSHANQNRRLGNIVVRVTYDTNGARLHHHSKRGVHRVPEPSFGESAEDVAMSDLKWLSACLQDKGKAGEDISLYQQDIRSTATLHMWPL